VTLDALDFQGKGHVLPHCAVGEEGEVPEHHAHLVAPDFDHLLGRGLQEVLAFEGDLAAARLDEL
jgi:hypothetical protein